MSYGSAAALQAAVFAALEADPALAGITVADALPKGAGPDTFVLIGPEEVLDRSDRSGGGAEHRFTVSVISRQAGFLAAKEIAVAISDRLAGTQPALSRGRVVDIAFQRAVARRLDEGRTRRIDLTFRARIET
jgi:hypothetical protein